MSQMLEIIGVFRRVRFRFPNDNGDVIIGDVLANSDINGLVAVKGQADHDELVIDQTYRFYGHWADYKNKRTNQTEQQFEFQSFVQQTPASREGIVSYLKQHGEGHGMGHARAAKLYDLFGSNAVRVAREEPGRTADALTANKLRFTAEQAAKVAANLIAVQAIEGCTLDLIDLVKGRGFPRTTARSAIKEWGNLAGRIVRRNPYRLMAFRGCGFKLCDALYLHLKLPPTRLKRIALCAWYPVASNTEGHTWFPAKLATEYVLKNIHGANADPERLNRAWKLAIRGKALAEIRTDGDRGPIVADGPDGPDGPDWPIVADGPDGPDGPGGPIVADGRTHWVAEAKKNQSELELAEHVAAAMREPPTLWPNVDLLQNVSDHQRELLAIALRGSLGILGGGPGTGKTYTLAALVKVLLKTVGPDNINIGAPTGKAAVRITENLHKNGVQLRARTWHSLLARLATQDERAKFHHKILIGDESSMNNTDLMANVFRARMVGTHVLLVGDQNQLPPVGHGAPLRDMIAAGLPYGELQEIKRNSGGIVEACAMIRQDKPWAPGDNLHLIEKVDAVGQIRAMIDTIRNCNDLNPIWDIQVVVAVNKNSPLSRRRLNEILRDELNSNPGIPGSPFRVGDKIVNTKNGYFSTIGYEAGDEISTNERGEVYVANGELGEVMRAEEKLVVAKLDSPRRVIKIPRGKQAKVDTDDTTDSDNNAPATGCDWDLGYALSVHKSQGSEWPVVIVMIDESIGARLVCDRAWLYTAISRAKDKCVLIGKKNTADRFCRANKMSHRKTLLKERVLLETAVNQLGEL